MIPLKVRITAQKPSEMEMEATNPFKIDGANLTPNEILFEKFFQKKFDSQEWLKKAKLKF